MRRKILILGASGMVGHMIYYYLSKMGKYELYTTVFRSKVEENSIISNVYNYDELKLIVKGINPNIMINCIGALINESNEHPDNAIYLNAYFPHALKKISDNIGSKLIHISTDCVFSGTRGNYSETDFRDADNIYGRSKALGEIINDKDVTLRTSVIGPELKSNGVGLFHWFMNQNGQIDGYKNVYWSGISTLEFAKTIEKVINYELTGLLHVTNGLKISKFDLLHLLKNIWNKKDVSINERNKPVSDKSLIPSERFNFQIPSYLEMLSELKNYMKLNSLYDYL